MGSSARTPALTERQAKEAHYEKMAAVAKLLVGSTPKGLLDVLSDFSFDVRSNDSIYEIWPTRVEMHDLLSQAGDLAYELRNVLQNGPMAGFLVQNSGLGSEDRIRDLSNELFELLRHAARAKSSRLLVGEDGQLLPGAGKPQLLGDSRWALCHAAAAEFCAIGDMIWFVPTKIAR